MPDKNRQLEALETIISAFSAYKNSPACISAARHRLARLLEGIEMYRLARGEPGYLEADDGFLFIDNAPAREGFAEKVNELKSELERKLPGLS